MGRARVVRSKTGCQSCRRRKVRCDERKPICRACERLELVCVFQPGTSTVSTEASKFRVRFVNSSYSKLQAERSSPVQERSSPQQARTHIPSSSVRRHDTAPLDGGFQDEAIGDNSQSALINSSSAMLVMNDASGAGLPTQEQPVESATCSPANSLEAGGGITYAPTFFDLNMNFDLLCEDWPTFPQVTGDNNVLQDPTQVEALAGEPAPQPSQVIINPNDHNLIQHYLNVMTRFTKIRSTGDENMYSQIFSNMALFYAPLYNATMAWTALHLGQTRLDPDLVRQADERYNYAVSLMHQDQDVAQHFELSLVTIWFALQFELLAARSVDSFCRHLQFTADLLYAHRRHQQAGGEAVPLGPIGSRILVWLGSYDARAAWIGEAGRLLQNLELFCSDYDFLDMAFPETIAGAGSASLKPCLRLTVELDMIEGRIAHLHCRTTSAPLATWSAVQADLMSIRKRLEEDVTVAPVLAAILTPGRSLTGKIATRGFNSLLLLASFYSVVIGFHRALPADMIDNLPSKLMSAENAAVRIVRIASWVSRFRPPSPQNIWPRILFMAGIETTDLVYQDWVLKTLSEGELWGVNVGKTRALLEKMIKKQSREGTRVDYLDVMRESTGLFII